MPQLHQAAVRTWHHIAPSGVDNPRLQALGFLPFEPIRVLRRSWWSRGAMVVQLGNTTFALRYDEASQIPIDTGGTT